MKLTSAVACLLTIALISRAVAAEIRDIQSLDELRALPGVEVAGGGMVRIGMSDAGPAGGPVLILYCWADRVPGSTTAPTTQVSGDGKRKALGPVRYEIISREQIVLSRAFLAEQCTEGKLFAASIPLEPGKQAKLVVRDTAGNVIGERDLPVAKRPPHVWHEFGRADYADDAPTVVVIDDEPTPAVVRLDGAYARDEALSSTQPTTRPSSRLPVHIVDDPDQQSRLRLSLSGRQFVLKHADHKLVDFPDEMLLARWWLNGKPIAARQNPPLHSFKSIHPRQRREVDEIRLIFGLPDFLGKVQSGDTIAVQVIYSPDGWDGVSIGPKLSLHQTALQRQRSKCPLTGPMMSNRFEFVLTDLLLKAQDHPMPPVERTSPVGRRRPRGLK